MLHALAPYSDEPDDDSVIGTDDTAWRRRLVLAVNRGLKDIGRGYDSRGGGGLLDEIPARLSTGRGDVFYLVHKYF